MTNPTPPHGAELFHRRPDHNRALAPLVVLPLLAVVMPILVTPLRANEPAGLRAEPLPPQTVIANTKSGPITLAALSDYYTHYLLPTHTAPVRPVVEPELLPRMPDEWLDPLARSYAIALETERFVDGIENPALREEYDRELNSWLLNHALPEITRERITERTREPTDEEIRARYERDAHLYRQPYQFSMRHIFLSTYRTHAMQEGETFESVAEAMCGDAALAARIRADVPGRPLRWVPPEERAFRLFKEPVAGERVLVPLPDSQIAGVYKNAEAIIQRLAEGADFAELARKYSQAEVKGEVIGPLPSGIEKGRGMLDALTKAAKDTPVGGITPVLRTPHGFTIMKIESRTPERVIPLEDAREAISTQLRDEFRKTRENELNEELFSLPDLKIEYDTLARAPEIEDDAVVVRTGAQDFRWSDLERHWQRSVGSTSDRAAILAGVRGHGGVRLAMAIAWARRHGVFEREGMKIKYDTMRTGILSAHHIKNQLDHLSSLAGSDEAVRKYYEEHKQRLFRVPARVAYQVIERRPPPGSASLGAAEREAELERMRAKLTAEVASLESVFAFMRLAHETNPADDDPRYRLASATPTEIENLPPELARRAAALEQGEWTREAFTEAGRVRAAAVTRKEPESWLPLGEVRSEIETLLRRRAREEAVPVIERKWLETAGYEFRSAGAKPQAKESVK